MNEAGNPPGSAPAVPVSRVTLSCLAVLSVATAVIHFAVAGEHFLQYWLFGVFMLVVAWLQLMWAILAVVRPSLLRLALWSGVIFNAGVVVVYVVTRTVGDVAGPTPNAVEPAGFGDLLCTVLEALVVAGCAWLLLSRPGQQVARRQLTTVTAATAAVVAVLLSVALVDGGPEMVMSVNSASASAGSTPGMSGMAGTPGGSSVKLASSTPPPATSPCPTPA
jgi:hypothetical protein